MTDPVPNLPAVRADVARADAGPIEREDLEALQSAMRALEHANVATRIANALGRQLGTLGRLLPLGVSGVANAAAERAIRAAMTVALHSLGRTSSRDTRLAHRIATAASGAAGGVFGVASLAVELPLSTIIMLRSIAHIARREGEDLSDPATALACLEVFALGARDSGDTYAESGYFAVRGLLAKTVSEAGRFALTQGLGGEAAPVLVRLIRQIGSRFGLVVSEKFAAQAVPIVGAAGGAAVNYAFAEHFQSLAFGHFTVRRLERRYGSAVIRAEYDRLLETTPQAA